MKDGLDGSAGALDVTQIRDLVFREGGRDTDDKDIAPAEVFRI
jgi:hypothetical protein